MVSVGSARRLGIGTALLLLVALCSCGGGDEAVQKQELVGFFACPAPFTECGGACVDFSVDSFNCGGCGVRCAPGTRCSSSACTTIVFSPDNCPGGFCSVPCPAGTTLRNGVCVSSACGSGLFSCADGCRDLRSSALNCGACGHACQGGQLCVAGACQRQCLEEPSATACGDRCVNLMSDEANCGACGRACPVNADCISGTCL